jgi:hypothetical protein
MRDREQIRVTLISFTLAQDECTPSAIALPMPAPGGYRHHHGLVIAAAVLFTSNTEKCQ